jgi:2-methylcitrate dehydratase PrpD
VTRQIEELTAFVATTTWDDVPASVQQQTKLVLLDTLGVILAGAERPEVRRLREQLGSGSGATVYARGSPSHDPRTAALLNGIAGRSIELCEGLRLVSGQAAMQVLPAVLAVGEQAHSAGRDMLTALLLGYDVAARLAGGFTPRPLAHQNGQVSLLAAAAAGARLRGLDASGISRAMRIATTLLSTPSYTDAVAGATGLNVAGGMSGFAGALAPELALAGFEAQDGAIEQAVAIWSASVSPMTPCWTISAQSGTLRVTTFGSTRAAIRSIRHSIACNRRWPNCSGAPMRSRESTSPPIDSLR